MSGIRTHRGRCGSVDIEMQVNILLSHIKAFYVLCCAALDSIITVLLNVAQCTIFHSYAPQHTNLIPLIYSLSHSQSHRYSITPTSAPMAVDLDVTNKSVLTLTEVGLISSSFTVDSLWAGNEIIKFKKVEI